VLGYLSRDTPVSSFQQATKRELIRICGRAVDITDKKSVSSVGEHKFKSCQYFLLFSHRERNPNPSHKHGPHVIAYRVSRAAPWHITDCEIFCRCLNCGRREDFLKKILMC